MTKMEIISFFKYILRFFVLTFTLTSPLYAWSNYFRFINNYNSPILISIHPSSANVYNPCGNINNIEVNPHSSSCRIEFATTQTNWHSPINNSGTITLSKKNDPNSYCNYSYEYVYRIIPYNYFDMHSEHISLQSCHGNLKPNEISVINDAIKALPRPLAGNVFLNIDQEKAAKSTESLSQADCGAEGGDNCMTVSPDMNTQYLEHGSTLAEAIALQNQIDRYEPLNFAQFIGSHNSTISRHYTNSHNDLNLSYSDPDHYLSITEQLNLGIRQIEFDIEFYNNSIRLCHNHVSTLLQDTLCEGNVSINTAINELHAWLEKNPNEFIYLYLDVNLPLTNRVNLLDSDLAKLEPFIFTPEMAKINYFTSSNALPTSLISKDDLIKKFHKNIIIINDDDIDNLKRSMYVFTKMQNSNAPPLYETSVENLFKRNYLSCNNAEKYKKILISYDQDKNHNNILRLNEYRTVIDYLTDSGNNEPNKFIDYYTTRNIASLINCPINIFSTSMIGYTCGSSSCTEHPTDPRLYSFLWSWELGYPLQNGGSHIAYINPKTSHFENNTILPNNNYSVLCLKKSSNLLSPTSSLYWYLEKISLSNTQDIFTVAATACANSGGFFAAPTTSYWMNDAMTIINTYGINPNLVIVNYQNINGEWIPNLPTHTDTKGTSLAKL